MTYTITFSEFSNGTVNPTFTVEDNVVRTVGQIVRDGAQPASPVIAANSYYTGPVFIYFEKPVASVSLMAGYFNNLSSTRIEFRDAAGRLIRSFYNDGLGVLPFSLQHEQGIASIAVIDEAFDDAGFSVDTVVFSSALGELVAPSVSLVAAAGEVDRAFGAVEGGQVLSYTEAVGDLDAQDFITLSVSADTTAQVRVFLNADPSKSRELTVDLKAGINKLQIAAQEAYGDLENYTIVVQVRDFVDANDEFVHDMLGNILGSVLNFKEVQSKIFQHLLTNADKVDDAAVLMGKMAKAFSVLGLTIDVANRLDNIHAANDWKRQLAIEATDMVLSISVTGGVGLGVSFIGTPIAGAVGGFAANLVYTYGLSDYVKNKVGAAYDDFVAAPAPAPAPMRMALAIEQEPDFSNLIFDEAFYLASHTDAAEAVASGAAVSGFAFYMTTGMARGDAINPAGNVVSISDLADGVRIVQPALLVDSQLGTRALGSRAGDLLSQAEVNLVNFINQDIRTADTELSLNAALSSLANRVAQDWVLNFQGSIDWEQSGPDAAHWAETLSNGESYQTFLQTLAAQAGIDLNSTKLLASWNAGATPAQVYESLAASIDNAQLLVGLESKSIGIAQVGGLWILMVSTDYLANDGSATDASVGRLMGKEPSNQIYGANSDEIIWGNVGSDLLAGRGGNDTIEGMDGDDILEGGAGDDSLDGGSGVDTARFSGMRTDYQVTYDAAAQRFVIADRQFDRDGVDTVVNVERFTFADGTFSALELQNAEQRGVKDEVLLLQAGSGRAAGSGIGNDTYVISTEFLQPDQVVTISDTQGTNEIHLVGGLRVAASAVTSTALQLTLGNGAKVTVLGANDGFRYVSGGDVFDPSVPSQTQSFADFVMTGLGIAAGVPTTGMVQGKANQVVQADGSMSDVYTPPALVAPRTASDNVLAVQAASNPSVGSGVGNDTYVINAALMQTGQQVTISDTQGNNEIYLLAGLRIASSAVTANALKLTLDNGAQVTVLGANQGFTYVLGGDLFDSTAPRALQDYTSFVTDSLGVAGGVPASGIAYGVENLVVAANGQMAPEVGLVGVLA